MRSFTTADQPGRCKRCLILQAQCVCGVVPTVATRTEVIVVRHEREGWKSTGTARIAALALPNLKLVEYCEDAEPAASTLPALVGGAQLLFPTPDATPLTPDEVPARLIVLDGTWRQARKMYAKLPMLHGVPRRTLPERAARVLRLREAHFEAGRSTLEAIAEALALLEGEALAAPLFALHDAYVERVFRARGVWEQKKADFERG
ncbi:MAG: tRNA-uridine aminocarboxypropyltransferase [Myxococcota bacterium]